MTSHWQGAKVIAFTLDAESGPDRLCAIAEARRELELMDSDRMQTSGVR